MRGAKAGVNAAAKPPLYDIPGICVCVGSAASVFSTAGGVRPFLFFEDGSRFCNNFHDFLGLR